MGKFFENFHARHALTHVMKKQLLDSLEMQANSCKHIALLFNVSATAINAGTKCKDSSLVIMTEGIISRSLKKGKHHDYEERDECDY